MENKGCLFTKEDWEFWYKREDKEQANKIISASKVITVQELARQTGVKISTANAFLIRSLEKGTVKRVAGHSGHHIYQPVSA